MMEAHGGEGVLKFFRYIADRTGIALGMFNSPSSGYVLTPAEGARIYDEITAVCATKEGAFRPGSSRLLHELAPDLTIWECDTTVYRAGWLRAGIVGPAQLGTVGYLYETPQQPILSEYWNLVWSDNLSDAMDYAEKSGLDQFGVDMRSWFTCYPGRPDYFTHWAVRSSTQRRCWVFQLAITPIPDPRRPSFRSRVKRRSTQLIAGWGWSPLDPSRNCGRHYR